MSLNNETAERARKEASRQRALMDNNILPGGYYTNKAEELDMCAENPEYLLQQDSKPPYSQ